MNGFAVVRRRTERHRATATSKGQPRPDGSEVAGRWRITELPDLDQEYLQEFPKRELQLEVRGRTASGNFEFGLVSGQLDGRIEAGPLGNSRIVCSFDGADEMTPVTGILVAEPVGPHTMRGEFRFHQGDTYSFSATRKAPASKPKQGSERRATRQRETRG